MKVGAISERALEVVSTLGRIVMGKDEVIERIFAGILANGHVLIEDYPGLAKTLIARLLAQALDLGFRRIQFTPDLLPSDITGRCSPTSSSPMRSTGPHRRRRRRCWNRCRRRR